MPAWAMNQAWASGITVQEAERWESLETVQMYARSGTLQDALKQ